MANVGSVSQSAVYLTTTSRDWSDVNHIHTHSHLRMRVGGEKRVLALVGVLRLDPLGDTQPTIIKDNGKSQPLRVTRSKPP